MPLNLDQLKQVGTDADYQYWCRRQPCAVTGEQLYLPDSGEYRTEYAHVRSASNSGTGFKAEYSGIPLMPAVHAMQHQKGELECLQFYLPYCEINTEQSARRWFFVRVEQYLKQWIKAKYYGL